MNFPISRRAADVVVKQALLVIALQPAVFLHVSGRRRALASVESQIVLVRRLFVLDSFRVRVEYEEEYEWKLRDRSGWSEVCSAIGKARLLRVWASPSSGYGRQIAMLVAQKPGFGWARKKKQQP